ncbi:50S ribosomal protein L22 [Candidatus Uhrbacteria bacterium]|nr:50S ribosomal protein L22 [Candidatus Uhrbacteria bacterium]
MDVHANLRHLRMSPRKVRLVVNTIRGLSVSAAETRLSFLPKLAAQPVLKLLRSAVANAEHNFKLDKKDLYVRHIVADGGPTLKRFRPRAFGRAAPIRKRTTHISLILAEKGDVKPVAKTEAKAEAPKKAPAKKSTAKKAAATK